MRWRSWRSCRCRVVKEEIEKCIYEDEISECVQKICQQVQGADMEIALIYWDGSLEKIQAGESQCIENLKRSLNSLNNYGGRAQIYLIEKQRDGRRQIHIVRYAAEIDYSQRKTREIDYPEYRFYPSKHPARR